MAQNLKLDFKKIVLQETSLLNQARIKLLIGVLLLFILQRICTIYFLLGESNEQFIWRSIFFLGLLVAAIFLLFFEISWRVVGHLFINSIAFILWTSILYFQQGINLVLLQYILLIISVGYYILGLRWGLIYSILNILPLILLIVLEENTGVKLIYIEPNVNKETFKFLFIYNFVILLFVHYYFFKAFKNANRREKKLSMALKKSLEEAQDIASAKTNFLSTMSHELRTPLNAVVGMANLLAMDELNVKQKENVAILLFSAKSLLFVINDILDFNKIEAGKVNIQFEPFSIPILFKSIHNTFVQESVAKKLSFSFFSDPILDNSKVVGDPNRITQILLNLIGNAIKFTYKGTVCYQANVVEIQQEKVKVEFIVKDTGIGISNKQQSNILEPYNEKSNDCNRQHYGTGLGLTIASRLIGLLGGDMKLESSEGIGTKISFMLEFQIVSNQNFDPQREEIPEKDISKLRVLVAEDNNINYVVLKKLLNKWGIKPSLATDGKQAVEALLREDFDVILMDINMPTMDGFEASKMIRNVPDRKKAAVKIIALTASVDAGIVHHPHYQYLNDFILKPCPPSLLKKKLDDLYDLFY
ncbi:ATP-binding protein [Flavobacterium agrisoli]|uniref:histidine kinase n=1 Tax=Flavobacterium agrisoli TaxID=2793066 RepID=A0A934UHZ2_9FLAO|nr:ATP-binding protein [Flavobacterium agrisoli]MBK0368282.1 response regulator [Flavobacterium agrisoli]